MSGADGEGDLRVYHVLAFIALLVAFVVVLETALHKIEHVCKQHYKYAQMLHKTTREIMIVGLIYMLVKLCTSTGLVPAHGVVYYAMDAADMFVFFVAISLVFQALVVFLRLRSSNRKMDKLSVMTAKDLVTMAETKIAAKTSRVARWRAQRKYTHRMQMKILGQFFLETYQLPQLFSFAKYIRDVQDSLIFHLIDVHISTWVLLIVLVMAFFRCAGDLDASYRQVAEDTRFFVFAVFATLWTVVMAGFYAYLTALVQRLVRHATTLATQSYALTNPRSHIEFLYAAMHELIHAEAASMDQTTEDSVAQMRGVAESLLVRKARHRPWYEQDVAVELIVSAYRRCCGRPHDGLEHGSSLDRKLLEKPAPVKLPRFSRTACQFLLQAMLIVNGLFYAVLLNCVLFVHGTSAEAVWFGLVLYIPLLFNTVVLAPEIVRQFALVAGTWRVDEKKLGGVIEHLAQVEKMKRRMVDQIHMHLDEHGQTLADIRAALEAADAVDDDAQDGFIEIDVCRAILRDFGFTFARHKFNTFVRLEFDTKGATIRYENLLVLLSTDHGANSYSRQPSHESASARHNVH